jgi:protein-S-isoprenylcysteine O-methyltransferase Ste14
MNISWWGTGLPVPWAYDAIMVAWVAAAVYMWASALRANRIKRREGFLLSVLDWTLLIGGYVFLFSHAPIVDPRNPHFIAPRPALEFAGVAFTYLGMSLLIWSRVHLGRYWSAVVALKKDHRLIQTGPYRAVRHPLYAGIILASMGVGLCVTTWSSLVGIALLATCFERRAHKEDALLASEFGAEFEAYRQRTGRLIPRLS